MPARENPGTRNRADPFCVPLFVRNTSTNVDIASRTTGAIICKLVAPTVKNISMWVGTDWEVKLDLKSTWIKPVDARLTGTVSTGWRFEVGDIKVTLS